MAERPVLFSTSTLALLHNEQQKADCDEAGVLDHPPCGTRHFNCGGLRDQHQKDFGVARRSCRLQ